MSLIMAFLNYQLNLIDPKTYCKLSALLIDCLKHRELKSLLPLNSTVPSLNDFVMNIVILIHVNRFEIVFHHYSSHGRSLRFHLENGGTGQGKILNKFST